MIRTPLRPLARILSAREKGENPEGYFDMGLTWACHNGGKVGTP